MSKQKMIATALVALSTVGAVASIAQNPTLAAPRPKLQRGIQPKAVPNTGLLYAVVNANSTLVRGNGAVSARRLIDGNIQVNFNRPVSTCAQSATIGRAVAPGSVDRGFINAHTVSTPNAVLVVTKDRNGSPVNTDFHLLLMCD